MADHLLVQAFSLAFFIHGDKQTAVRIVVAALAKLEVALTAQYKRLYYQPTGRLPERRHGPEGLRNKVTFSDLHLLQRLVFVESEPYEKERERRGWPACSEADLVRYFVKHLARITTRRNSFYVTLGISRLLYNFTTAEAMEIYNLVIQDPDRVKDDYYFRARKAQLMTEIKERFGDLIQICIGPRGEKRFHSENQSPKLAELVTQCLAFFTPWDTKCLVPQALEAPSQTVAGPALEISPDEDQLELERIHTLLHPNCFERLTRALGLNQPSERLRLPHFYLAQDGEDRQSGAGPNPPELSQEEILAIRNELAEHAARRRASAAGLLRIIVDGRAAGEIDLRRSCRTKVQLNRQAELIELRSGGATDVLMGSYLVSDHEDNETGARPPAGIVLEGGEELTIRLDRHDGVLTAEVTYRETRATRAARLFLNQAKFRLSHAISLGMRRPSLVSPLVAALLLIFLVVGWLIHLSRNQHPGTPVFINQNSNQINTSAAEPAGSNGAPVNQSAAGKTKPSSGNNTARERSIEAPRNRGSLTSRASAGRDVATSAAQNANRGAEALETEVTREIGSEPAAKTLNAVRSIYLQWAPSSAAGEILRPLLLHDLQRQTKFVVKDQREEADALLRLNVRKLYRRSLSVEIQMLNVQGNDLLLGTGVPKTYHGPAEVVAKQIVDGLTKAVDKR